MEDKLIIRGIEFQSRLWVGTGKYKDFDETARAIEASGADMVTVAVRRVNIIDRNSRTCSIISIRKNSKSCRTLPDATTWKMPSVIRVSLVKRGFPT